MINITNTTKPGQTVYCRIYNWVKGRHDSFTAELRNIQYNALGQPDKVELNIEFIFRKSTVIKSLGRTVYAWDENIFLTDDSNVFLSHLKSKKSALARTFTDDIKHIAAFKEKKNVNNETIEWPLHFKRGNIIEELP